MLFHFTSQVAHQRFLCALKAHFEYQNALLMRIKSAGVLPGMWSETALQNQRVAALKNAKVKLLNLQPNNINERRVSLPAIRRTTKRTEMKLLA